MTNVRQTVPQGTFNWPVIAQGLLASVCLLGFSSMPDSSWLVYGVLVVLAYTVHAGVALRRLTSSFDLSQALFRWCPRLLATMAVLFVAGFLADGPKLLAVVGSLLFALTLVVASAFVGTILFRAARFAVPETGKAWELVYELVCLHARLVWLSVNR